jgi:hypothetical protein
MPTMTVYGADGRPYQHPIPDQGKPAPKPPAYLAGLDIGQRDDWTALAIVEQAEDKSLTLVALERVRRIPYPEIARLVADTVGEMTNPTVLVDCTGVGRPVTDQLTELGVRHTRISIHGGSTVGQLDDGTLSVPKRDLIAALVVGFESRRLRIARGLRHVEHLEREAASFQMKLSAAGHDSYSAREGEHDDLLLAVALPVWHAGQPKRLAYVW